MITIRNENELYGEPIEFHGETIEEAIADMQSTIRQCGPDFANVIVEHGDYSVVEDTP